MLVGEGEGGAVVGCVCIVEGGRDLLIRCGVKVDARVRNVKGVPDLELTAQTVATNKAEESHKPVLSLQSLSQTYLIPYLGYTA